MTAALLLLAVLAPRHSRTGTGIGLAVFGLGFGMVGQILIVAVQNSVERRELGSATATTSFFRGLGGAIGAAALGAVFAARAGVHGSHSGLQALGLAAHADIIPAVQAVFIVAAPLAALALLVTLALPEIPLQTRQGQQPQPSTEQPDRDSSPVSLDTTSPRAETPREPPAISPARTTGGP